jgi:glycosyltransferase involved in cell wall biosynthesis
LPPLNEIARAVTVLGYNVSLNRPDGGGQRVQAFLSALESCQGDLNFVGLGPQSSDELEAISSSLAHRVKRRFLPVPLRRRAEAEIVGPGIHSPAVSLVPALNRIALRGGHPCWLDFPDLYSDIARNHASTVDPLSALGNHAQAWVWSRREADESEHADVVTAAAPSDLNALGPNAIWLPTPVADNTPQTRRPSTSRDAGIVYGFIANFDYPPNRHAYELIIRQRLASRLPAAQKVVVAGYGSEKLPRAQNVEIIGPVDAISDFYDRIDVALAPIDQGGGMKVKVVEAMMHGLPVIATEHVKRGLPESLAAACIDIEGLLAGSCPDFPSRLRDPREDPAAALTLQRFTFARFKKEVSQLWRAKMVP